MRSVVAKVLLSAALAATMSTAALAKGDAIKAPAGAYKVDPNHASMTFKIVHFGLSNYTARFTKFDASLQLDPAKLQNSSITLTIDPKSVRTDFAGDYKGTHKDSPFSSFDEAIGRSDKFLNADKFPEISFKSTKIVPAGKGFKITGDLTFLGVTKPVTLDGEVVGSIEKHPYMGVGVVGFSAKGKFKRSDWGMTGTQAFLSDDVQIIFEGEFDQAK